MKYCGARSGDGSDSPGSEAAGSEGYNEHEWEEDTLPVPDDHVPPGTNEDDNLEIRRWGKPRDFTFEVKDHVDLGELSGMLDFQAGAKITGSRFSVMRGGIARMHRALSQFMLDTHQIEHGYEEVNVPYLVNRESLYGTG